MTKKIKKTSNKPDLEEQEREQQEQEYDHYYRAYKHERIELDKDRVSIKNPIHISKDRLRILDKIVETMDTHLDIYLRQALYEKIDSDLHSPEIVVKAFCDNLLEQWNTNNDTNDYRILQNSTRN